MLRDGLHPPRAYLVLRPLARDSFARWATVWGHVCNNTQPEFYGDKIGPDSIRALARVDVFALFR